MFKSGGVSMNKVFIAYFIFFFFFFGCHKKEEPKGQTPMLPDSIQLQNEIRLLQGTVRQNPKNINAWTELGNILMDTSRFQEAIDAYQKALALDPKNVDVIVDMATCYRRTGKSDRAVEEFRKAIRIKPLHPFAHRNLAVVLAFDLGDKKQAIKEFEEYLKLSPDTPDTLQIRQEVARLKTSK
jgi:cytochrome c-type biogenesis protein CcmH/NrfG